MELTQEQIQALIDSSIAKMKSSLENTIKKMFDDLDIPDARHMATKKLLADSIESLKTAFEGEFQKTNTAITKVAEETEVKITALKTEKSDWKNFFKTILDYES